MLEPSETNQGMKVGLRHSHLRTCAHTFAICCSHLCSHLCVTLTLAVYCSHFKHRSTSTRPLWVACSPASWRPVGLRGQQCAQSAAFEAASRRRCVQVTATDSQFGGSWGSHNVVLFWFQALLSGGWGRNSHSQRRTRVVGVCFHSLCLFSHTSLIYDS